MKIRFPGEYARCCTFDYEYESDFSCVFRSPHRAIPEYQYVQEITFLDILKVIDRTYEYGKVITKAYPEYITKRVGYVFRTRTKVDENGNLIGAYYGKFTSLREIL